MTQRRARGEALALICQALREHPRGLSTREISAHTGIEPVLARALLANYRAVGHVDSAGVRAQLRWFIGSGRPLPVSRQLVTPEPRSVFAPPMAGVTPQFALASSRVMCDVPAYVKPDDFSEGAFMADWRARRAGKRADVA